MFVYTRAYFKKLIDDINLVGYLFNVITPVFYIAYLLYAIFLPVGFRWANVTLLVLTLLYLVFYISTYDIKNKDFKATKKRVRHIFKGIKLGVTAMTLGITIYGIYVASTHTTAVSVVLSSFMALFWVVNVFIEIMSYIIEYQSELFLAAIEADKNEFLAPVNAVGNFVKRVTGKEPTPTKEPKKILRALDSRVGELRRKKKGKSGILNAIFGKNDDVVIEENTDEEETV